MVECKKYTTILILIHATCNSYISDGGITRMTTIIANLRFSLNLIVTFNLFGENIKLLVYFNIRTFLYNTLNAFNRHTHTHSHYYILTGTDTKYNIYIE